MNEAFDNNMKFAVTKEALLEGLQRIQNVVSTRSTLPVLTNALLETTKTGLRLTTTDFESCYSLRDRPPIERAETTLPARRLAAVRARTSRLRDRPRNRRKEHLHAALQHELFGVRLRPGDPPLPLVQEDAKTTPFGSRNSKMAPQNIVRRLGGARRVTSSTEFFSHLERKQADSRRDRRGRPRLALF